MISNTAISRRNIASYFLNSRAIDDLMVEDGLITEAELLDILMLPRKDPGRRLVQRCDSSLPDRPSPPLA